MINQGGAFVLILECILRIDVLKLKLHHNLRVFEMNPNVLNYNQKCWNLSCNQTKLPQLLNKVEQNSTVNLIHFYGKNGFKLLHGDDTQVLRPANNFIRRQ